MSRRSGSNFFSGLLSFILLVFVLGSIFMFGAKKILFDYDGVYASDRITYTDEFGFSLLITYHTKYQSGDSKGFAIVRIPPEALVKDTSLRCRRDGDDIADSDQNLSYYESLLLSLTLRTADIPGKGNYYIIEYRDTGKNSSGKI